MGWQSVVPHVGVLQCKKNHFCTSTLDCGAQNSYKMTIMGVNNGQLVD